MALYAGMWGPEAMLWSRTGAPARSVPVTVLRQDDGLPATLYTDRTKAALAPNPTMTDSVGNLLFFADPDEYTLVLSGALGTIPAVVRPDLQEPGSGGGGVTDHGLLTGLSDDDHPQYLTAAEGNAAYAALAHLHDDPLLTEFGVATITGLPHDFLSEATPSGTVHLIAALPCRPGRTVVGLRVFCTQAGAYAATATPAQAKAYTMAGVGLGSSPNDPALWLATGWRLCTFSVPFVGPVGGLAYAGVSFGGFTGVKLPCLGNVPLSLMGSMNGGKRLAIYQDDGAGLPVSFNPATWGGATSWMPPMGFVEA